MGASHDPYKELFERSADAILIIEGDQFVDCNDATVKMLRYATREEVLKTHPSELSPPTQPDGRDSFEKANEMISIAFAEGSHRFEWTHQRADGEAFPVEVLLTAIEEGENRKLHVVWRDITNRRQLEEQLRHAQKMEAVGKLAGGIAHDFNNLLVVILGHAELLGDRAGRDSEIAEHAQAIKEASQSAATLVKQLLAFGRKQQRLPEVLDLNALVARLQKLLERLIGEDLLLETRLAESPLNVKVDPGQVEQVVMNLVSNARDASPDGGTLRIRTERVVLGSPEEDRGDALRPGPYAVISVADSGTGMPSHVMARAFDPFFTTKEPGRGTGLGLSTVYGIVQQSHGAVRIESTLGHGTTVRVYLPLSGEEPAQAPAVPREPAVPGGPERVLVVEDSTHVRSLVENTLKRLGYEVMAASDGDEGARVYLEHGGAFDLVISDVIMPKAGAAEMMARLNAAGHEPRVLFVSGYTDDTLSARHALGESVDLLEKPFTPAELAERVRAALDR